MGLLFDSNKEIVAEAPVDLIVRQVKRLLTVGQLKPGDKLPAERQMADQFGVGRSHVREALKKMESYGIIKTLPQSGSVIAGLETSVLEGLITDILKLDNCDFYSLVETRLVLEMNSVRFCALRRTDADIEELERTAEKYNEKIAQGLSAVEEDLAFHRAIATGSKNSVLKSLLLTIIPDIISNYAKHKMCSTSVVRNKAMMEHMDLIEAIKRKDAAEAEVILKEHLNGVMTYAEISPSF